MGVDKGREGKHLRCQPVSKVMGVEKGREGGMGVKII
jgi:hypothetical protein